MLLLPLVLAALADATRGRASRARAQELANRLGVRPVASEAPGTRARMLAIYCRYGDAPWIQDFSEYARYTFEFYERTVAEDGAWPSEVLRPRGTSRPWLPPAGTRSAIDPFLPWLADRMAHRYRVRLAGEEAERGPTDPMSMIAAIRSATEIASKVQGHIRSLVDWADATSPALSTLLAGEAIALAEAWHEALRARAKQGDVSPGVVVRRYRDGATIERLVTRTNVEDEGLAMEHCVGGHWGSVRAGRGLVFSYRDPAGVPRATWEIRVRFSYADAEDAGRVTAMEASLVDLEGPGNLSIEDPGARVRVATWLREAGVDLGEWGLEKLGIRGDADWITLFPCALYPAALVEALRAAGRWEEDAITRAEAERALGVPPIADLGRLVDALDESSNADNQIRGAMADAEVAEGVADQWARIDRIEEEWAARAPGAPLSTLEPRFAAWRGDPGPPGSPESTLWVGLARAVAGPRAGGEDTEIGLLAQVIQRRAERVEVLAQLRERAEWNDRGRDEAEDPFTAEDAHAYARAQRDDATDFSSQEAWTAAKALVEILSRVPLPGPGWTEMKSHADDDAHAWGVKREAQQEDGDWVLGIAYGQGRYGGEPRWGATWIDDDPRRHYWPSNTLSHDDLVSAMVLEGLAKPAWEEARDRQAQLQERARAEAEDREARVVDLPRDLVLVPDPATFVAQARAAGVILPPGVTRSYR